MANNGVKTGKAAATLSSKLLKSEESSKIVKKVSGSALSNAKDGTKQKKR